MKLEAARIICRLTEAELREDYSGRGMFGETTAGIVADDPSRCVAEALMYCDAEEKHIIRDGVRWRRDSMGLEQILY